MNLNDWSKYTEMFDKFPIYDIHRKSCCYTNIIKLNNENMKYLNKYNNKL